MGVRVKGSGGAASGGNGGGGSVSAGWEDAPTEITDRGAIIAIYGDTGTGRTSLALTAPGAVAFTHAGEKITGIVQKAKLRKQKEGHALRVLSFAAVLHGDPEQIQQQAVPIWHNFRRNFMSAVAEERWARVGIIDTHNELWELLRLAQFGELNPKGRTDNLYGPVNAAWRALFKWHRAQPEPKQQFLIVIGQTKDEYIEKKTPKGKESIKTGNTVATGQKEVHYMADVVLRTSRDVHGEFGPAGGFVVTVEKGWYNSDAEGLQLYNEDATIPKVMALITGTEEEEWM